MGSDDGKLRGPFAPADRLQHRAESPGAKNGRCNSIRCDRASGFAKPQKGSCVHPAIAQPREQSPDGMRPVDAGGYAMVQLRYVQAFSLPPACGVASGGLALAEYSLFCGTSHGF